MAEYNLSNATTTDLKNQVPDFIVNAKALENASDDNEETHYYFTNATTDFGYYTQIPEVNSAANALATYTVGLGWQVRDNLQRKVELENVTGTGFDTFNSLMWNHFVTMVVVGDAFMEIVRSKNNSRILNLLPISPERVRLVYKGTRLIRYDVWNGSKWISKKKEDIFHTSNNRIGDEMHGQSQLNAARWIIDARNEALIDNRKILHRGLALGIAYYKTNNTGKITFANQQIEKAVKNGEMLGLPEDTAKIEQFPTKDTSDRLENIRYLENFFYQVFGVNRSIATSDGTTEVGGINGQLIFEVQYLRRKRELEAAIKSQLGITVIFEKPVSLAPQSKDNQTKNTGTTSILPSEVAPSGNR